MFHANTSLQNNDKYSKSQVCANVSYKVDSFDQQGIKYSLLTGGCMVSSDTDIGIECVHACVMKL